MLTHISKMLRHFKKQIGKFILDDLVELVLEYVYEMRMSIDNRTPPRPSPLEWTFSYKRLRNGVRMLDTNGTITDVTQKIPSDVESKLLSNGKLFWVRSDCYAFSIYYDSKCVETVEHQLAHWGDGNAKLLMENGKVKYFYDCWTNTFNGETNKFTPDELIEEESFVIRHGRKYYYSVKVTEHTPDRYKIDISVTLDDRPGHATYHIPEGYTAHHSGQYIALTTKSLYAVLYVPTIIESIADSVSSLAEFVERYALRQPITPRRS